MEQIDQVILHDGRTYDWSQNSYERIRVLLGKPSVSIDDSIHIPCLPVDDDFVKKAKQLVFVLPSVFGTGDIKQLQRPVALTQESDSGDETVIEPVIEPAFRDDIWNLIQENFRHIRYRLSLAVEDHFENGSGKYFMNELMLYSCNTCMPKKFYVNMGTTSSGTSQPGTLFRVGAQVCQI